MTAVSVSPGRVEVLAVGLVEWDRRKDRPTRDNRLRYDGTVWQPGQLVPVDRKDVPKLTRAKQIQVLEDLPPVDWWGAPGRILQCEPGEAKPMASEYTAGALRIVQGTGYDPGNAAYRFHTAVNEHTPHASAFVRYMNHRNNPFACPWQYAATKDTMPLVRSLLRDADVVHCHIDPRLTQNAGLPRRPRLGQTIVRHYHGTQFNGKGQQEADFDQVPMVNAVHDDVDGYVLVGARLTVCALRPGRIHWLPITVPVARYRAMVTRSPDEWPLTPFRIAHSPTRSAIKGTKEFLRACARLTKRGVPVMPVLIQRATHAEALKIKSTADACFDSFALGIQGSGLEAAAMGQPVIAGDADVASLYRASEVGDVPYTFAGDAVALEQQIERLATDRAFYVSEAARVGAYVREYHDYPAVAARYNRILADADARRVD